MRARRRAVCLHHRTLSLCGWTLRLHRGTDGVSGFAFGRHSRTLRTHWRTFCGCRRTHGFNGGARRVQGRAFCFDRRTFRGVNRAAGILCGAFGEFRRTSCRDCGAKSFFRRALRLRWWTSGFDRRANSISHVTNGGLRRALSLNDRTARAYRRALRLGGRTNGRGGGALCFHSRTNCGGAGADGWGGRTARYQRRTLGRGGRALRCLRRASRLFGRTNRDRCGAGGRQHLHNRHHWHGGFPRFPCILDRPFQSLVETGPVQPNITRFLVRRKLGRPVVATLDVVPRAFGAAGRLQPALSIPVQLDEDVEKAGPKISWSGVVASALQQRCLAFVKVVCVTCRRITEKRAASEQGHGQFVGR